jgi:hypothetical protein
MEYAYRQLELTDKLANRASGPPGYGVFLNGNEKVVGVG